MDQDENVRSNKSKKILPRGNADKSMITIKLRNDSGSSSKRFKIDQDVKPNKYAGAFQFLDSSSSSDEEINDDTSSKSTP